MTVEEQARFILMGGVMYSEVKIGKTSFEVVSHFNEQSNKFNEVFEKIILNNLVKLENS